MNKINLTVVFLLSAALSPAASIVNGGFESGLSGWTRADQTGSEGGFVVQTGTVSPANSYPVPAPQGTNAAMSDGQGPGSHVLYQSFVATAPVTQTFLQFSLFVGNRGTAFATPATLDFATPTLNQQARVDILRNGANPFSVSASDVLLSVFRTNIGDGLISGYNTYSVDVTSVLAANLNATLLLRFAEVDNVAPMQLGIDGVQFQAVPEPASWLVTVTALAAGGVLKRRFARRF